MLGVCVSVCVWVTEAGRDLFMHNKLIWLIIEDVWNLFAFIVGSLSGNVTFTAPKKVHPRARPKSACRTQMDSRMEVISEIPANIQRSFIFTDLTPGCR